MSERVTGPPLHPSWTPAAGLKKETGALPRALVSMVRIGAGFDPSLPADKYVEAAPDGLARSRVSR